MTSPAQQTLACSFSERTSSASIDVSPLSILEEIPREILQMILDDANSGTVTRLMRSSTRMHHRISNGIIKWLEPHVESMDPSFRFKVENCHFSFHYDCMGKPYITIPVDERCSIPLENVLKSPFRFKVLQFGFSV